MPKIARITDPIICGDRIGQGSPDVFANNLSVTRNNSVDMSAGHGCFPPTPAIQGSSNVFTNNLQTVRVGDGFASHSCKKTTHPVSQRKVADGSPNVYVNEGTSITTGFTALNGVFLPPPAPETPVTLEPSQVIGLQNNVDNPQQYVTSYNIERGIENGAEVPPPTIPTPTPEVINCNPEAPKPDPTSTQLPDVADFLSRCLAEASTGKWLESRRTGGPPNSQILALYADVGFPNITTDSVHWCAAFTGAVLKRTCHKFLKTLRAADYNSYGVPIPSINQAKRGDVIVFKRDGGSGHVCFIWEVTPSVIKVVGGNQSDNVTLANFRNDPYTIQAIRRPIR